MPKRYQVIIVGGGPVGHGVAISLAQRGISCALVERHADPVQIPKGQNLSHRTVEHFWFWNCEQELRAARTMPKGFATGGITLYQTLLTEHWHSSGINRQNPIRDYYLTANERLPQYRTEDVLRARAAQLGGITAMYGRVARSVAETADGVRVVVADAPKDEHTFYSWSADAQADGDAGGDGELLEADYLIGCDGGRSMVRDAMGIDRDGRDFDQRMALAVFRSRDLHTALKRYPDCSTYRVLKPALKGYWQFFGRIDVGEGFFFHAPVPPGTDRDNFDFDALLAEAVGRPIEAELEHIGFWDLRIKVASRYRNGRMFIAGDAAHQHPPYGGFGLNTGLEDAVNLTWKLAAVLEGWGGAALLDSYGAERRPIMTQTAENIIAGGIETDRGFLERCASAPDAAAFAEAWEAFGRQITGYVQTYKPHYEGSPVVFGPEGGATGIRGEHGFAARAGHHLPPRPLSSGQNVFEALGPGFTLLGFAADEARLAAFGAAAAALGVPLKIIRDGAGGATADYGTRMILVRPDQHIAWIAKQGAEDDPYRILARATGRGGSPETHEPNRRDEE